MRNDKIKNIIFVLFNTIVLLFTFGIFIYIKVDMNRGESKLDSNIRNESAVNNEEEVSNVNGEEIIINDSTEDHSYNNTVTESNASEEDYSDIDTSDNSDGEDESVNVSNNITQNIVLVNKEYLLDKEYEPKDLVTVNVESTKQILLRQEVAESLEKMFSEAELNGIKLIAVSGFRSYQYQENVYNDSINSSGVEYTEQYVAIPGTSEHQTGLAVDVGSKENTLLTEEFEETKEYKWLYNNMHRYGFIVRYPKDKENITMYEYEPWHIRYVGQEVATYIMNEGITLEEYLQ